MNTKPASPHGLACQYVIRPFEWLQGAGFGRQVTGKLDRFHQDQERQGATVVVVHWQDGTWCVLAQRFGPLVQAVALDDGVAADLYEDARSMLHDGYLPKLVARFEAHGRPTL